MATPPTAIFPPLTREHVLACQFSSWYPIFAKSSLKSTVIRPLESQFQEYLHADGVFVPEGSDNRSALFEGSLWVLEDSGPQSRPETEISDDGSSEGEEDSDALAVPSHHYSFPDLDAKIREVVKEYGGVFPKLNWTSPRVHFIPFKTGLVLRQQLDPHRTLTGFSHLRTR